MKTYTIAKQATSNQFWLNAPKSIHILQRSLEVSEVDLKGFITGVVLRKGDVERFITPKTLDDNVFWANGLDGATRLKEAFKLFDSIDDATHISNRWVWTKATIYKLAMDMERMIVFFEEEMRS